VLDNTGCTLHCALSEPADAHAAHVVRARRPQNLVRDPLLLPQRDDLVHPLEERRDVRLALLHARLPERLPLRGAHVDERVDLLLRPRAPLDVRLLLEVRPRTRNVPRQHRGVSVRGVHVFERRAPRPRLVCAQTLPLPDRVAATVHAHARPARNEPRQHADHLVRARVLRATLLVRDGLTAQDPLVRQRAPRRHRGITYISVRAHANRERNEHGNGRHGCQIQYIDLGLTLTFLSVSDFVFEESRRS